MTTSYRLVPVDTSDAEDITRGVDIPAMQNGPLFRTTFPTCSTMSSEAWEVMTQWYINGLEEALKDQSDRMFFKVSQRTHDGVDGSYLRPAGFCGCEIIARPCSDDGTEHHQQPAQKETYNTTSITTSKHRRGELPEALEDDDWLALSEQLRVERQRV